MIAVNGQSVHFETFPNGETRIDGAAIISSLFTDKMNAIDFKYQTDTDLLRLMFVRRYVADHKVHLRIWYMPYSRQDRRQYLSTVFTLRYVCDFINDLHFDAITVVEPHSDVTCALLNNCLSIYPTVELMNEVRAKIGFDVERDYLFYPDAGAQKRYGSVFGLKSLVAIKQRNFQTGQITSLDVVGDKLNDHPQIVIVDDLCSYGGTFLLSAERLAELGAGDIYLFVTHCERSVYDGKMIYSPLIKGLFTTNSILEKPFGHSIPVNEKIHVFDLKEVFRG